MSAYHTSDSQDPRDGHNSHSRRTVMACIRCRESKRRCDGGRDEPCERCRSKKVQCVKVPVGTGEEGRGVYSADPYLQLTPMVQHGIQQTNTHTFQQPLMPGTAHPNPSGRISQHQYQQIPYTGEQYIHPSTAAVHSTPSNFARTTYTNDNAPAQQAVNFQVYNASPFDPSFPPFSPATNVPQYNPNAGNHPYVLPVQYRHPGSVRCRCGRDSRANCICSVQGQMQGQGQGGRRY